MVLTQKSELQEVVDLISHTFAKYQI